MLLAEDHTIDLSFVTTTNYKVKEIFKIVWHTNFSSAFMVPRALCDLRLMNTKELVFD